MADMAVRTETSSGRACDVVTVSGELDLPSHDALRGLTGSSDLEAPLLVLDLTDLTLLDSAGIGAIVLAQRQAEERGAEVVVVASSSHLVRVLEISGVDQTVRVCATVEEALQQQPG